MGYLLLPSADEQVSRTLVSGLHHQGAVRGQEATAARLVVLVRIAGAIHFLYGGVAHVQLPQRQLRRRNATCDQDSSRYH